MNEGWAPPSRAPRDITDLNEKVAHLAATTILANIDREKLLPLAPVFETAHYEPGEVIAREGEVDTTLRVLVSGTVSLQHERPDGGVEHRGLLAYGASIGLRGVFTGAARDSTAIALEPVSVLYLDGAVLWEILRTDADMLDHLLLPDEIRRRLKTPSATQAAGGEAEVARFRRHWITVVPLLLFFPGLIFLAIALLAVPLSRTSASPVTMLVLAGFAIAAAFGSAAYIFLDWWRDFLSITNRRVLHVEETPLIDARRSAARLERIQDARFVQSGIVSRIFNYGDLIIQTAGSKTAVKFKTLARPAEARTVIFEQVKLARDLAQSERQALIARKILAAMGKAPMTDLDAPVQMASSSEDAPLRFLGPILSYLTPRARVEDADGTITWRKHWWFLLIATWMPALFLALMLSILAWIELGLSPVDPAALDGAWLILGLVALVLLLWLWWQYEDWRNDLYVLTDELIIDIERKPLGLFAEQRQAPLSQIQDVRYVVPNPLAAILKFGDVLIETAAEHGGFTFDFIYHPESVQEEIFLRMEQRLAEAQKAEQDRRDDELIRWLGAYHRAANFDPDASSPATRLAEWMARNPPPS